MQYNALLQILTDAEKERLKNKFRDFLINRPFNAKINIDFTGEELIVRFSYVGNVFDIMDVVSTEGAMFSSEDISSKLMQAVSNKEYKLKQFLSQKAKSDSDLNVNYLVYKNVKTRPFAYETEIKYIRKEYREITEPIIRHFRDSKLVMNIDLSLIHDIILNVAIYSEKYMKLIYKKFTGMIYSNTEKEQIIAQIKEGVFNFKVVSKETAFVKELAKALYDVKGIEINLFGLTEAQIRTIKSILAYTPDVLNLVTFKQY
ncbi:MAG: hypothetical protein ACLKAK_07540 [Alkaliphilus sp.]